ncbi:hypothetical protein GOQ29_00975, partial [Clostridium sp. D2Q-14]|uniref:hypothetical protein n=1 Tax=Anaeromonas gelatinilytica TaxID=2683194 RepID=UPI001A9C8651
SAFFIKKCWSDFHPNIYYRTIFIMYMKGLEIIQRKIEVLKIDNGLIKVIDINKQTIRIFKRDYILIAMNLNITNNRNRI